MIGVKYYQGSNMKKSPQNPGRASRAGEAARKQLISREMRFVLQQDVGRFTKQLLARLLDEGCNLHPDLARIMFYERFERRLASDLPADSRIRFCEKTPDFDTDCTHSHYHAAVKYFLTHLPDAETQITATVLDVIEALKLDWQRIAKKCLSNANPGDPYLQNLIEEISRVNPDGILAQHGLDKIRRRLKIAVVTSLMRHVRKPELLRETYGSVPLMLQGLSRDPAILPAVMATLKEQVPYAQHVTAQSFWRTLNNMDTELPDPDTPTKVKGYPQIKP
jgi:hypothetical protein